MREKIIILIHDSLSFEKKKKKTLHYEIKQRELFFLIFIPNIVSKDPFGSAFSKQKGALSKNVKCLAFGFVILKFCIFENDEDARFWNAADCNFFKIVGFELKSAISFHCFFKYETPKIFSQNCIMTKIPQ